MGLSPALVQQNFQIISEIHSSGVAVLMVEQNATIAVGSASAVGWPWAARSATVDEGAARRAAVRGVGSRGRSDRSAVSGDRSRPGAAFRAWLAQHAVRDAARRALGRWGLSSALDFSGYEYKVLVADVLRGVLDGLGLDQAHVVGGSIGNVWALRAPPIKWAPSIPGSTSQG
jgi:hypothetical protein